MIGRDGKLTSFVILFFIYFFIVFFVFVFVFLLYSLYIDYCVADGRREKEIAGVGI